MRSPSLTAFALSHAVAGLAVLMLLLSSPARAQDPELEEEEEGMSEEAPSFEGEDEFAAAADEEEKEHPEIAKVCPSRMKPDAAAEEAPQARAERLARAAVSCALFKVAAPDRRSPLPGLTSARTLPEPKASPETRPIVEYLLAPAGEQTDTRRTQVFSEVLRKSPRLFFGPLGFSVEAGKIVHPPTLGADFDDKVDEEVPEHLDSLDDKFKDLLFGQESAILRSRALQLERWAASRSTPLSFFYEDAVINQKVTQENVGIKLRSEFAFQNVFALFAATEATAARKGHPFLLRYWQARRFPLVLTAFRLELKDELQAAARLMNCGSKAGEGCRAGGDKPVLKLGEPRITRQEGSWKFDPRAGTATAETPDGQVTYTWQLPAELTKGATGSLGVQVKASKGRSSGAIQMGSIHAKPRNPGVEVKAEPGQSKSDEVLITFDPGEVRMGEKVKILVGFHWGEGEMEFPYATEGASPDEGGDAFSEEPAEEPEDPEE